MSALLHPTYFPSIAQFSVLLASENTLLEVGDNYQKQTYRNRMYLYSANGKQILTVPVRHSGKLRQRYCDVLVDNSVPWQRSHLRTLESAYRSSAYYEYYEDDFSTFFNKPFERLTDCNIAGIEIVLNCMRASVSYGLCRDVDEKNYKNYKYLTDVKANKHHHNFNSYFQVFSDRYGFLENLSILDLVFNIGPQAQDYLLYHSRFIPKNC